MDPTAVTVGDYFLSGFLKAPPSKRFPVHNVQIMTLYFALESLDVAEELHRIGDMKTAIIQYIYSLQIVREDTGGFLPSSVYLQPADNPYHLSHIVFTYSALNCLKILGDDLSRLSKQKVLRFVGNCRKEDGSYSCFQNSEEADLRFVYAAICICSILDDFSPIDLPKTLGYIERCYNFDGGYGLRPHCESHSGGVYTALASLKLLNRTSEISQQRKRRTLHFLACRQTFNLEAEEVVGVQGRVGKLPDSCYSFWVGASIQMLVGKNLLTPKVANFLELCQMDNKTYSKYPFMKAGDPQHTLHSLVGNKIVTGQAQDLCLEKGIKKVRE